MEQVGGREKLISRDFVLICVSNFLAFFSIYLIVPVLPVFLEHKGYSNFVIGALMSMMTVAALLRPFFGRLSDLRGRHAILIWGTLLLGISNFLYIAFGTAAPLFIVRFFNGFGLAAFHTAAYAMISDLTPASRRLQGIAILYMSVDATIAIAPVLAKYMSHSWGYTQVYVLAGCLALMAFLASLFVRERKDPEKATDMARPHRMKTTSLQRAIYINTMGFTLTFGALSTFIILSSLEKGIEQGELFFTAFAVTLIAFRLLVGKRVDQWPRRPLILTSAVVTLAGLVMIAQAGNFPFFLLGSFVYALGFAYLPTSLSALLLDYTPPSDWGSALGIFLAVFDVGVGMGAFAMGPLADAWGYAAMYLAGGVIALAGLIYFTLRTWELPTGKEQRMA